MVPNSTTSRHSIVIEAPDALRSPFQEWLTREHPAGTAVPVALVMGEGWPARVALVRSGVNEAWIILVASARDDLQPAVDAGVAAYVSYDDDPAVILAAIRACSLSQPFCSPTMRGAVGRVAAAARAGGQSKDSAAWAAWVSIGTRAQEVALAAALISLSIEKVAVRLHLTPDGVKFHLKKVYAKLGIRGRRELRPFLESLQGLNCEPSASAPAAVTTPAESDHLSRSDE